MSKCLRIYVTCYEVTKLTSVIRREARRKRPLGKPRRRWVDNIRTDLGDIGSAGVHCICLAQDRDRWRALVNAVMKLRIP
jgi:hypothetical protein